MTWPTQPLGALCSPKQWKALPKSRMTDSGYPVYGANGVIGFADEFTHAHPTILVGCRGSIGAVHVTTGRAYATSNTMALDNLRTDRVDPRFLARFLSLRGFRDVTSGTSQPQLTRQNMLPLEVPVPPLPEQRRITAILDHADALRAKRREFLRHLEALTLSIFHAMFGRSTWAVAPLGDVARTSSGRTPDRSIAENYGGGIPWVKSGELHAGVITDTEETLTEVGLRSSSAKLLPPGTVLIAMYGATAGVVGQLGVEAATNQAICAVTPGSSVTDSFLIAFLRSQARDLLERRSGGAQPNLSQGTIRSLEVPIPPMGLQQRFAERVQCVARQRNLATQAIEVGDELFVALQSRAFRGEL
jgi:type I restriction enzyme S subunit